MPNSYFQFKQFTVYHHKSAMKVTTDTSLFGAWCASELQKENKKWTGGLDIGAGTGLLSLMVAQKNRMKIDAVEIEASAAEQAAENVAASPWKDEITIYHQDVLQFSVQKQYDVIFSNPPFYENELVSVRHEKNVAHHSQGLKLAQLLQIFRNRLSKNGLFFLLLPYKRMHETESLLHQNKLQIIKKVVVKQSVLHQPFRIMLMGSNDALPQSPEITELIIRNEQQEYSADFTALLKDYYLYL